MYVFLCTIKILLLTLLFISDFPHYLENKENQEKSGNLKIDQKIEEKSGDFIKLTDNRQLSELHINVKSRMCIIRA